MFPGLRRSAAGAAELHFQLSQPGFPPRSRAASLPLHSAVRARTRLGEPEISPHPSAGPGPASRVLPRAQERRDGQGKPRLRSPRLRTPRLRTGAGMAAAEACAPHASGTVSSCRSGRVINAGRRLPPALLPLPFSPPRPPPPPSQGPSLVSIKGRI